MAQTFGFMLYVLGLGLGLAICVLDSITVLFTVAATKTDHVTSIWPATPVDTRFVNAVADTSKFSRHFLLGIFCAWFDTNVSDSVV